MTAIKVSATSARRLVLPAIIGLLLGLVVLGPLIGGGWTWMLDAVSGPHPNFPRTFFGLDGGVVALEPLAVYEAGSIVGRALVSWLPFLLVFPVAMVAMYRALDKRSLVARLGGGLFFCLTPVVFDRTWAGHAGFLLGYALLPLVWNSLTAAAEEGGRQWVRAGAWIALATALSPHFIWISLVLLIGTVLVRRPSRDLWSGAAIAVIVAGLCSAHLLASSQSEGRTFTVNKFDVAAYASHAVGHDTLLATLGTLRGFWRPDVFQSSNSFPGRPILILLAGLIILLGVISRWRHNRQTVFSLSISAVIALFLAAGAQGPTGGLFMFLFNHLPGFAIMREPQKFVAVIALTFAIGFGNGLDRLLRTGNAKSALIISAVAAIVVPASLSPGIFWAYGNHLKPVSYPSSWTAADNEMGTGPGAILALPWHEYETFPFLNGRIVTTPMDDIFRRPVIEGDDVELPNLPTAWNSLSSAYLSYLYTQGPQLQSFGALVAPMNVQYVVLTKNVDWATYGWLKNQRDLKIVSDSTDITVFQNMSWVSGSYSVQKPVRVADWGELAGYANEYGTVAGVLTDAAKANPVRPPANDIEPPTVSPGAAVRRTAVSYRLRPNAPNALVVTSETYNVGWSAHGKRALESPQGTVMVSSAQVGETVTFRTWYKHLAAYLIASVSVITTVTVCAGGPKSKPPKARSEVSTG